MEIKTFLLYNLPIYYFQSNIAKSIFKSFDKELDRYSLSNSELKNQFFVTKATYALRYYEEELGLSIEPQGLTIEERRSRVLAKLRSVGTTTVEMVKNVVSSWTNSEVEIIENYKDYCFEVKFIDKLGVPSNMQDVYNAVEEIKPAHLCVKYIFRYRTHAELKPYTHEQLKSYTHEEIRELQDINGR